MNRTRKTFAALLSAFVGMSFGVALAVAGGEVGKPAPEITGQSWLNSKPLKLAELKGKVVLVEFWTLGCFNCRNVEPQVKAWHQKYSERGLVVIAVHAPEFNYERALAEVQRYVRDHAIAYPVAIDNNFITWDRYKNHYWPAMYLIDKQGLIRYLRIGEGGYRQTEQEIIDLLAESAGR